MANRKVTLLRYCKTENGWRRFPMVVGKTGKVRPNAVLVDGKERVYPEGYYCVRTYEGDKPKYTNVGTDPMEALLSQQREERLRAARDSAQEAGTSILEPSAQPTVRELAAEFLRLKALEPHRSRDTMDGYNIVIRQLVAGCGAEYPDQIQSEHILEFCAGIERQGLTARTRSNRFGLLCTFLRFCKVEVSDILSPSTRRKLGRFPKTEPTAYTHAELDRLLFVCGDYYRLLFTFLTNTGFRMQEAMYLTWADVSFADSVVSVKRKPGVFEVKDYEERSVPLLTSLAAELLVWRERRKIPVLCSAPEPIVQMVTGWST